MNAINQKTSKAIVIDKNARNEATRTLKEGVELTTLINSVRDRFKAITQLLRQPETLLNQHDLSHQMRTSLNSVALLERLGFSKRETLLVGVAGIMHDIGYIRKDVDEADKEGYNAGVKGWFKKHALHGANELEDVLKLMLEVVNNPKILEHEDPEIRSIIQKKVSEWRKMLEYKDENGEVHMIDTNDVQLMREAILHHNDYGKEGASYDPTGFNQAALATQLFDKLDIVKDRIDERHVTPHQVHPEVGTDPHGCHRRAPWCVTDYHFSVDPQEGMMRAIYEVNLNRLSAVMQAEYPGFIYTEEAFVNDFNEAYSKSCRVAAEAAGILMNKASDTANFTVELRFKDGNSVELPFARPKRPIYSSAEAA